MWENEGRKDSSAKPSDRYKITHRPSNKPLDTFSPSSLPNTMQHSQDDPGCGLTRFGAAFSDALSSLTVCSHDTIGRLRDLAVALDISGTALTTIMEQRFNEVTL